MHKTGVPNRWVRIAQERCTSVSRTKFLFLLCDEETRGSRTHPFLWKLWVPQLRRARDFRATRKLFLLKTAQIFSLMSTTSLKCWHVCLALPPDTARKGSLICCSLTVGIHQMLVEWICKWRIDKWKNNEWPASDTSRKKKTQMFTNLKFVLEIYQLQYGKFQDSL